MKTEVEQLQGRVENVVYRNETNDYTVLELETEAGELMTAVGTLPPVFEGELLILNGRYTFHKEFGRQFSFDSFEKRLPEGVDGILQYLSSRVVKGVGPVTALKIVNRFGTDTFDVMENHPEWLADIPGITMKKAAAISESFREQSGIRGVLTLCGQYLASGEAVRVYKRFGAGAVGLIQEDPYILTEGENGIAFPKVDDLAHSLGFPQEDERRVLSGMRYLLSYNAGVNGHTCLPREKLIPAAEELLGIPADTLTELLNRFLADRRLCTYQVSEAAYIMTPESAETEDYIARRISELDGGVCRLVGADIEALVAGVECRTGLAYGTMQKRAIYQALEGGFLLLTGGPGTGKTTVIKALLTIFRSLGLKTVLAAPTGRAAKRMSEATSEEAKTVHRMLEMERSTEDGVRFGRGVTNPLEENAIIVDEASMLDVTLMAALLRAVPRGGRLILIGDADQLPSVGAGNVLGDLLAADRLRTVCLTEIFRQSEQSLIVTNAHRINGGEPPILSRVDADFFFVRRDREADIPQTVCDLIVNRLPRRYGADIRQRIQVITPSKKGSAGVETLNAVLQEQLNPPGKFKRERVAHGITFREGDRVMQITNDYDILWERRGQEGSGIFNGDIGVIERIDVAEEMMRICFDDRVAQYSFSLLDELDLAYAITVHKSQGSEYPVVILPMYSCPPMLMTRNLLYTAVTRARQMVILVGRADIPARMVANNREVLRYTTLCARLRDYF